MTTTRTYRVVKTDGYYGVMVDGDLVNDGYETILEAQAEAKRQRREDLIADLRDEVSTWVDSFDGDDSVEAVSKLRKAIKVLSA